MSQATGFADASRGLSEVRIVDANTVWGLAYDGSGGGALSCLADMDANDTAFCSIYQHAGAAQLNVVYTGTSFNGILIG